MRKFFARLWYYCAELWYRWGEPVATGFGMSIFVILGACLALVCLPLFILLGIAYFLYYTGFYLGAMGRFIGKVLCFVRDRMALPLLTTLGGLLMGICGGTELACIFASFGFIAGVVLEFVRATDSRYLPSNKSFGMMPFDEGGYTGNGGEKPVPAIYFERERPWTWKGFQVTLGPKEDDLLKED